MNPTWMCALAAASLGWASLAQAADAPPLAREDLARCASQVQTLREESSRLTTLNSQLDTRRVALNQRTAALQAERDTITPDDLRKGLDFQQRAKQHRAEAETFNGQIEQIKRDITALNRLRDDYDRACADRPYRRSDLDALPEAARNAMRAGLSGVQVPYLDPTAAATPGEPR